LPFFARPASPFGFSELEVLLVRIFSLCSLAA
jgi:hypothetical protein